MQICENYSSLILYQEQLWCHIKKENMLTRNSAENDEGKLRFPVWQDHSQDKVEFLLRREEILQPCAPPTMHMHY